MHPDIPFDPDTIPKTLGSPPRKAAGGGLAGFFGRILKPKITDEERHTRHIYENGVPLWGAILKVNNDAWRESPKNSLNYGLVLVAPELPHHQACLSLPEIADWIMARRGTTDPAWDDEMQRFMDWVDDDQMGDTAFFPVPRQISGEIECGFVITRFPKADLLGGKIRKQIVPAMVYWDVPIATVLPGAHWPADYLAYWNSPNDEPGAQKSGDGNEPPPDLIAFEVSNLPAIPDWLDALHQQMTTEAEAAGIACLFVNTGCLSDSDRTPVPGSGELQYLGKASQMDRLLPLLGGVIQKHLATFPEAQPEFAQMPLEDFFDRFGDMLN